MERIKALHIKRTKETPEILFDPENDYFEISHRSIPENPIAFYKPVIEWLKLYSKSPNKKTVFNIKLEYFNTSSKKQLGKLLLKLEELAKKHEVITKWYYEKEDTSVLEEGKRYQQLIQNLTFEFVPFVRENINEEED